MSLSACNEVRVHEMAKVFRNYMAMLSSCSRSEMQLKVTEVR